MLSEEIPVVVKRMQDIREGSPGKQDPRPDEAMRILQVFALYRDIDDLLNLESQTGGSESFAPLDARVVLALAALTRPVEQAATLAIKQWKQEKEASATGSAQPQLTDRILHDVTAQRTVQDVAEFIAECRRQDAAELVDRVLEAFVATETSGRTSLDKAYLYIALRAEQCDKDASDLLGKTLHQAGKGTMNRKVPASRFRVGVVGALRHLSPSEKIVEDWINEHVGKPDEEQETIDLVAGLLLGEPEGSRHLAEHVALTWKPYQLIHLCEILAKCSDESLTRVRRQMATRPGTDSLAGIIERWYPSGPLAGTFQDLLADIVEGEGGAARPRTIKSLDNLHKLLALRNAPVECRRELRVAVAAHVEGRTGAEVASLLGKVEGRNEPHRAAQIVNRRLTERLLASKIDARDFADYLDKLQEQPEASNLTFSALRALSALTASGAGSGRLAPVIGGIAAALYENNHASIGFKLLERCLENEQWLNADDAVKIVGHVRRVLRPGDRDWDLLLSRTAARWADTSHKEEVVNALRAKGYDEDVDAINQPVQ
ncbi:MAG: hypothetical protein J2P25_17985 [Nocardiopsaceae bacterium]|nr:hypothetical protein [Nocardiopsaceae bacterium]